jgi:hypothetical protein
MTNETASRGNCEFQVSNHTLAPNEKEWDDADRELIHDFLPDYMVLSETQDIRVGRFFQIECGSDVRIDDIKEETDWITELFESLGVDISIPLVGLIRRPNDGRDPTVGYKVEIENCIQTHIE